MYCAHAHNYLWQTEFTANNEYRLDLSVFIFQKLGYLPKLVKSIMSSDDDMDIISSSSEDEDGEELELFL